MTGVNDILAREVARGERFQFGENWRRFLDTLDDERIEQAKRSLQEGLALDSLDGLRVLDIGSGSGLFSLAAVLLDAEYVHSFDYDPESVRCTRALKQCYAATSAWQIEQGSALDRSYVESLGVFDIVYAWGVLHHTGDMYRALELAAVPVAEGGSLFISIYNDQGGRSRRWMRVKRLYSALPTPLRTPYVIAVMGPRELRSAIAATLRLKPHAYVASWTQYKRRRGMSRWHDLVDWCGGYPFEVAKPEEVFDFYQIRGFSLRRLSTAGGGLACNEFVLVKNA